jgi:hypothetical protein
MARSRQKLKKGGRQFEGGDGPPDRKSAVRSNESPCRLGEAVQVLQSSSGCIGGGGRPISQRSLLLMPRLLPPPSSI